MSAYRKLRLLTGYTEDHSVNTEQGQTTGDDPEIDGQLTTSGQCTFPEPIALETRVGDKALVDGWRREIGRPKPV
jgi:hypothetical protein